MHKRGIEFILLLIILLSGCASKTEKEFWDDISKSSCRYEQLRQTEKIIIGDKKSEQIILLTYLYDKNSKANEHFIISVYGNGSQNSIKKITEEGNSPISMKHISRSLLPKGLKQIIPVWFSNYAIEFPHTKLKKFRIIITPTKGKEKSIYFYKDMRYIIDSKKINKII